MVRAYGGEVGHSSESTAGVSNRGSPARGLPIKSGIIIVFSGELKAYGRVIGCASGSAMGRVGIRRGFHHHGRKGRNVCFLLTDHAS